MMSRIALLALLALVPRICAAADPRYPDWPCAQAKVPDISLAAVWAGPPLGDAETKWKDDAAVNALVGKVAARKTPLDDAQKAITAYLSSPGTDKATAGKLLFAGLFEQLNAERSSVMSGLERVTRKQRAAADKIRSDTLALQALQDVTPPDQPKIDVGIKRDRPVGGDQEFRLRLDPVDLGLGRRHRHDDDGQNAEEKIGKANPHGRSIDRHL